MLSLEQITLEIDDGNGTRRLLDEVSLQVQRGQFIGVIGPSGCGKSTLLKIIGGLSDSTLGSVKWDGVDLAAEGDLPPSELGYVPQFSLAHDLLTVRECVDYATRLRVDGLDPKTRAEHVEALLGTVGLDPLADREARVLSGGQRRRLSLAIETVSSPSLLLCDEVTSGLDPGSAHEILTLLHTLSRADGGAQRMVINVTHSLADLDLYDRIIVLYEGRLVFDGWPQYLAHYFCVENPEEIYRQLSFKQAAHWQASWLKHSPYFYALEAAKTLSKPEPPLLPATSQFTATEPPDEPADDGLPGDDEDRKKPNHSIQPRVTTPGALAQFAVIFERRLRLFARDRAQLGLQFALILGFPCLVVIFALRGLPGIRNLSMANDLSIIDQLRETASYQQQAFEVGGLVSGLILFQIILLALMGSNNGALEIAGERLMLESEKLAGLRSASYLGAKCAFLSLLVTAQSFWMGMFVHFMCGFPGDLFGQIALLFLADSALTAVCLAFSSFAKTPSQASLISIYFVGFQLPLSGAVLALPETIAHLTRPFVAAYWSWSGVIQTMRETRFYDLIQTITKTDLSVTTACFSVLLAHVLIGVGVAYLGCKRSSWNQG